ncbi:dTDP-4-amino-4,6-dideoxygalactose transaminase [Planctomycetes bacterium CA13]|uniref:dTDP-4-amino-4,6-dideoxygalactose transaminase n=1 Tax=Novipirellula herctigrandis TaxID=2527986 RepID=A0A5C5ZB96_9BACT|nr:dTDP-4-amino-4,6-dideoxygalactose transaminase [Planctomycetes bacterium CA13]
MADRIPLCEPYLFGNELDLIGEVLQSGYLCGDGPFTKKCHEMIKDRLQCGKALLTTSCTHALEMTAMLLDLQPGDEVILPSFTFVSTANAYTNLGANPVFVDIRPDTLNIDESAIEQAVTSKTRAIAVVHYAGVGCEMDKIMAIGKKHNLPVIEDTAHAIFGKYKGRPLGAISQLGTASFHHTKNFTSGEGGALLINDPAYEERAEIIREKGTNRSQFIRGQVDRYTWCDKGSSYLPSEILVANLIIQLENFEFIQSRRRELYDFYVAELSLWAEQHDFQMPAIPDDCESAYHLFWMLAPTVDLQRRMLAWLRGQQIEATFHYQPLHDSTMGHRWGYKKGDLPVTESVASRMVRLPFYTGLSMEQASRIVDAVKAFDDWE